MIRIIIKNTVLFGLLLVSLSNMAAVNPLTVRLQAGATTTLSQGSTGTANYLVTLNPSVPGALQWRVASGLPNGVTQVTTGAQACGGIATCAGSFNLSPGESCCLKLLMTGGNMTLDGNRIAPLVQSTPTPTYSGQGDTLNVTVTAATEATVMVTPSTLALSVTGVRTTTGNNSGTARVFTIENTGPDIATGIVCPTPDSPSIDSINCSGCDNLASGATCTVTITPTATPSAAVADATPTPITLTIEGDNTNTLSPTVNVLTYGSFYQAGWLFSIIETADASLSIGGTVAAESDNAAQESTKYSLGGASTTDQMYSGTEGAANTNAMLAVYGDAGTYSATVCTSYAGGGYTNWYLPAICQMGFGGIDSNFNCGASPGSIPNMQYDLLVTNPAQNFNFVNNGFYWSSTASEEFQTNNAWAREFEVGGGVVVQDFFNVDNMFGVRCVRAIT
jgi:hypothetical protein